MAGAFLVSLGAMKIEYTMQTIPLETFLAKKSPNYPAVKQIKNFQSR
jgi:hypothetical protein